MRKIIELLQVEYVLGILIILFSIVGCSEMPYTGSNLGVHEVDRYLVSTDGNVVCFQDALDSTCLGRTPGTGGNAGSTNASNIHIYPERNLYRFYHEGKPVVSVERVPISQTPTGTTGDPSNDDPSTPNGQDDNNGNGGNNDNNGNNNGNGGNDRNNDNNNGNGGNDGNNGNNGNGGNNDNNNGNGGNNDNNGNNNGNGGNDRNNDNNPDDTNDGHGWLISIYYPEGTIAQNPPTLGESGVTVTINGKQLTDDDITGFAQFIGSNNEVGVQFFYPTKSAELLDLKVRMEGLVAAEDPVRFNINYLWNSQ